MKTGSRFPMSLEEFLRQTTPIEQEKSRLRTAQAVAENEKDRQEHERALEVWERLKRELSREGEQDA